MINGDDTEKCRLAVKLLKDLIEHMKTHPLVVGNKLSDTLWKKWG